MLRGVVSSRFCLLRLDCALGRHGFGVLHNSKSIIRDLPWFTGILVMTNNVEILANLYDYFSFCK